MGVSAAPTTAAAKPPTGRLIVDPYRARYKTRQIKAPMYSYYVRNVTKKTFLKHLFSCHDGRFFSLIGITDKERTCAISQFVKNSLIFS